MRLHAIGLIFALMILGSIGCQENEIAPTEAAVQASPQPTVAIGVAFITATPANAIDRPADEVQTPATDAPPTETATPTAEVYVVQSGDTLVGIAAARGTSLDELLALNPDVQPELLLVGQSIVVPPRPEIEPTSLPANDGPISVEISGLGTYSSASGGTWVLGEVVNNGPQAVELIQVGVTLKSPTDEAEGSETLWVTPVTIPSLGRAPFGVLFSDSSPVGNTAEAEVVGGRQMFELGNRYLDLAVVDAEVTIGPSPIRVSGRIENQGSAAAGQISIVTTFYDDQGSVTGFHELALGEVLEVGESRPFSFIALPPGARAVRFEFAIQATVAP